MPIEKRFATETLLFAIQLQMRERDVVKRVDVRYPYDRLGPDGQVLEHFEKPPVFDIRFVFVKKRSGALFKIQAVRLDLPSE